MSTAAIIWAGVAISAFSQLRAGQQQAELSEEEASFRRREAAFARARAATRAAQERREGKRRQGARRAAFGASGITLEGSPTDVLADAAMEEELGIRIIEFEGEREAARLLHGASLAEKTASATREQAVLGAGSTILTGAGRTGAFGNFGAT